MDEKHWRFGHRENDRSKVDDEARPRKSRRWVSFMVQVEPDTDTSQAVPIGKRTRVQVPPYRCGHLSCAVFLRISIHADP